MTRSKEHIKISNSHVAGIMANTKFGIKFKPVFSGKKKKLKNMSAEKNIYKEKDKIKNRISQETSFRLATLHV